MSTRKVVTTAVLVCLLGVLIQIVYTRGLGMRLGAAPAALSAPFTTEEAWVVDEIVRDITELSSYPQAAPAVTIAETAPGTGAYRVTVGAKAPTDLNLRSQLWSPAAFAAVARDAFDPGNTGPSAGSNVTPVYASLVQLTPAALVAASASISQALRTNVRDASAHEAAALTIATFALRESAARMADTRWAMNRITAHLATATALRGPRAAGIDARLAEAILLTLTDRQTQAIGLL